ncbi:putative lipoprotein with Yx(FWY)xxD motif [Kibdelosporangium banguiense]|uniref:Lipoprotein with Yx(FWY)xxD motif n=1 Tax=Kibdelosporangium banguiense TaxID=1365924 RepID=A0ABS4TMS0_9PSEU|nr:putative lipoprotein with Yx(FWY)xxD motif [Kibdelosporangium banguiense]
MRKHVVSFAALITVGVAALSACGNESGVATSAGVDEKAATEQVDQSGLENLTLLSGTAKSNNAPADTGDWAKGSDGTLNTAARNVASKWVQLKASKAGELNPVVVNGAGLTLYRFDKDTAKPSKSNCNGDCAVTWPPVTVSPGSRIFIAGIKKADVGVVKRDNGELQVTIGGWPVYRFNKDKKPGDTLGQGVGGTWFGVTPDGKKAGAPAQTPNPTTPPPANGPKATSAVLFDDANFSDNGPSQGVGGKGCQNLSRPGVTSSVSASGSLKLWTEKDCKGKSLVVDGDVTDLAKVDFDNKLASVFLG